MSLIQERTAASRNPQQFSGLFKICEKSTGSNRNKILAPPLRWKFFFYHGRVDTLYFFLFIYISNYLRGFEKWAFTSQYFLFLCSLCEQNFSHAKCFSNHHKYSNGSMKNIRKDIPLIYFVTTHLPEITTTTILHTEHWQVSRWTFQLCWNLKATHNCNVAQAVHDFHFLLPSLHMLWGQDILSSGPRCPPPTLL